MKQIKRFFIRKQHHATVGCWYHGFFYNKYESIGHGFDEGYFHALNGIRSAILATGKTEAIISVQLIDAMIAETKKQLEGK